MTKRIGNFKFVIKTCGVEKWVSTKSWITTNQEGSQIVQEVTEEVITTWLYYIELVEVIEVRKLLRDTHYPLITEVEKAIFLKVLSSLWHNS